MMKTNQKQNNIPDGWTASALQDLGVVVIDGDRGKNYPKRDDFFDKGYCLFLNAGNVSRHGFSLSEKKFISKEKDSAMGKGRLNRGDLVITTRGTVGNIAYFSEDIPHESIRINSGMAILRNEQKNIQSRFFLSFLNSILFEKELARLTFGSAQPQLTINLINKLKVKYPTNKDEQDRIVAVLETWDAGIEKLKQKIEIKKQIKKGLMQQLLTGKKRLPGFGGKWETVVLGEVGQLIMGQSPKGESYTSNPADTPLLNGAVELKEKGIHINKYTNSPTRICNTGDLLFCIRATIGNLQIADKEYCLGRGVAAMSVYDTYNKSYISRVLIESFNYMKRLSAGGVIKGLKKNEIEEIEIKSPPLKEQKAIAEVLTAADDEIAVLEQKLSAWQDQKKYLLNNLVTGQIRTPEDMVINQT